ncbi:MAG TPA: hypothetical protein PKH72_12225 [Rhodoferax sp.]|jgi:hypothetical protein|nr:DUF6622 family protein [Rhodoferax sp.]HNV60413.1 hypothetical protein [Rhodoferax sp.]HPW28318.1 hypothetical protein [Rhodoferax sp.]
MLMQILTGTPKWVFALFVALLWLGMQQMLPRKVGLNRATLAPVAMTLLSLYGVTSAFGDLPLALLGWLGGAAMAFTASMQLQNNSNAIRYDATNRRFQLPGSIVPLTLFMGIFFTKYAVGVSLNMQPGLAREIGFALPVSTLYGVFSGVLLARTARLWRMALQQAHALQAI